MIGTRSIWPTRSPPSADRAFTSIIASANSFASSDFAVYRAAIVQTLSFRATSTVSKSVLRKKAFPRWRGEIAAAAKIANIAIRTKNFRTVFFFLFLFSFTAIISVFSNLRSRNIFSKNFCSHYTSEKIFVNTFRTNFPQKFVSI